MLVSHRANYVWILLLKQAKLLFWSRSSREHRSGNSSRGSRLARSRVTDRAEESVRRQLETRASAPELVRVVATTSSRVASGRRSSPLAASADAGHQSQSGQRDWRSSFVIFVFLEWNCELQLESIALGPVLHRCFMEPLERDATLGELVANLRPYGKYSAAMSVEKLAAVHLVVGELIEPIANYTELERVQ